MSWREEIEKNSGETGRDQDLSEETEQIFHGCKSSSARPELMGDTLLEASKGCSDFEIIVALQSPI